jgi:hypothetical protein
MPGWREEIGNHRYRAAQDETGQWSEEGAKSETENKGASCGDCLDSSQGKSAYGNGPERSIGDRRRTANYPA